MKRLNKSGLYAGFVFLAITFILGYYKLEPLFPVVVMVFIASCFAFVVYFKSVYQKRTWENLVNSSSQNYKGISSAVLDITDKGIGISYGSNMEFIMWEDLRKFKLQNNRFLIVYSNDGQIIAPLVGISNEIRETLIDILAKKGLS